MITLEQSKVGMRDHIAIGVIDEFRRGSYLLERLIFDNAAASGTGGSTLSYGYKRTKTPSTASFRAINNEYTNNEAIIEELTAYCRPFGGSFKLDRVIIDTAAENTAGQLAFQLQEKVKGAINLFHYAAINGDRAVNNIEFDGLDVALTGSSTEFTSDIDLSTSALMDTNYNNFLDMMDEFVSGMSGMPDMFLCNGKLATKIKGVARRAGYFSQREDAFGRPVDTWNGIPIVDLEHYFDPATQTTRPVVGIASGGTTSLYAVQIGVDGFHGISPQGTNIVKTSIPDLEAPGAIKEGDVEMVAGVVLKNSLKAGVFRNIRVQGV
jgi:hypothetical protein